MISPEEGAYAFEAMLRHNRAHTGYAPVIGTPWLTDLAARSPFAEAFASSDDRPADTSSFRAELHSLPREEWPTRVRRLVAEQLSLILRRSIDPDRPISEHGLTAGQPRAAHPDRDRDGYPCPVHGHHHRSGAGREPVRDVGW